MANPSRRSSLIQRPYRMSRRAEAVEATRQRIIEATVALHGTVGPAATTVAGIAGQAGVTRATVYRHFPDEEALFQACSSHWLARRVTPNPTLWAGYADPGERLRVGLSDLYRFYRSGESMLRRIYADEESLPEEQRNDLAARHRAFCGVLLAAFPQSAHRGHELVAVISHAVEFSTWWSLCRENGLTDAAAVELMVQLAAAVVNEAPVEDSLSSATARTPVVDDR